MTGTEQWSAWGARAYGSDEQWKETKRRYWASRWTLFRRCLWCRSGQRLELNHLTYVFTKVRAGWTPLWLLVPLCHRCHGLETRWTRKVRKVVQYGEHAVVTFGVYLLTRCVIVGAVWTLWRVGPWAS